MEINNDRFLKCPVCGNRPDVTIDTTLDVATISCVDCTDPIVVIATPKINELQEMWKPEVFRKRMKLMYTY